MNFKSPLENVFKIDSSWDLFDNSDDDKKDSETEPELNLSRRELFWRNFSRGMSCPYSPDITLLFCLYIWSFMANYLELQSGKLYD